MRQHVTLLVWLEFVKTTSKKSTESEELFVNGEGHDEVSAAPGILEGCAVQLQGVVLVVLMESLLIDCFLPTSLYHPVTVHP